MPAYCQRIPTILVRTVYSYSRLSLLFYCLEHSLNVHKALTTTSAYKGSDRHRFLFVKLDDVTSIPSEIESRV
jgi:hypothetical protein